MALVTEDARSVGGELTRDKAGARALDSGAGADTTEVLHRGLISWSWWSLTLRKWSSVYMKDAVNCQALSNLSPSKFQRFTLSNPCLVYIYKEEKNQTFALDLLVLYYQHIS